MNPSYVKLLQLRQKIDDSRTLIQLSEKRNQLEKQILDCDYLRWRRAGHQFRRPKNSSSSRGSRASPKSSRPSSRPSPKQRQSRLPNQIPTIWFKQGHPYVRIPRRLLPPRFHKHPVKKKKKKKSR